PENIIEKKITYSLPEEEGAEPRKNTFNIEYVPEEGKYFIIDEVMMGPREVVTLEVRVNDIWTIPQEHLDSIKQEVEAIIAGFALAPSDTQEKNGSTAAAEEAAILPDEGEMAGEDPAAGFEETESLGETAKILQEQIFAELDAIATRQAQSSVLLVGVEKHMDMYYKNVQALSQVRMDVIILRNLLEPEAPEGQEAEKSEATEEMGEEGIENAGEEEVLPGDPKNLGATELLADPTNPILESETREPESPLSE
ncbi:MAG TPA: hypothetical protein PKV41_06275, partial [Candidatus Omnitrophota bacterium]|nr:hypothetical protein [Candidatus Omnitrophota bacterium]